jgi:hypothetical protein
MEKNIEYLKDDYCFYQVDRDNPIKPEIIAVCTLKGSESISLVDYLPDDVERKFSSIEFFLYHYRNVQYILNQKVKN